MELFANIRRDARAERLSIRKLARRRQLGRDTVLRQIVLKHLKRQDHTMNAMVKPTQVLQPTSRTNYSDAFPWAV